jgi:hypothetical protein
MKINGLLPFETSKTTNVSQSTWRNIQEDLDNQQHRCDNSNHLFFSFGGGRIFTVALLKIGGLIFLNVYCDLRSVDVTLR